MFLAGCAQLKQCAYEGVNRDQWQQPDRVLASLEIQPGATVADLGAGSGYFTFKLAEAAGPGGKVYAVDIDSDMISIIRETAKEKGIGNIEPILARSDDPLLPKSGIDLIFTSNTYHHIENRIAYFAKLRQTLRPGGRLAIIELDGRSWIEGVLSHSTPKETIRQEMEQAGYALERDFNFLDRQSFVLFTPKS
jgi:ubiquinone/menaquinone biosynthesis C-methylase UbiE